MYHKTVIAGYVGSDPQSRFLADGKQVANFSVACNNGGSGDNKKTIWYKVSIWGKRAETIMQYVKKGSQILVEGQLMATDKGEPRTWTAQNGETRASFELRGYDFSFLGRAEQGSTPQQQSSAPTTQDNPDDDIPF